MTRKEKYMRPDMPKNYEEQENKRMQGRQLIEKKLLNEGLVKGVDYQADPINDTGNDDLFDAYLDIALAGKLPAEIQKYVTESRNESANYTPKADEPITPERKHYAHFKARAALIEALIEINNQSRKK